MRGFATKWRDVPDFIKGITGQIREDRKAGSFRRLNAEAVTLIMAAKLDVIPQVCGRAAMRRECALFDETAICKQIHLATGDHA